MDFKDNTLGREPIEDTFLTPEHFEGLEAIGEVPPYSGEGSTSFTDKYDIPKMKYLEEIGVNTPGEWLTETGNIKPEMRALFVTMFIVTGNILVTEDIKRTLGEDITTFIEVLKERNTQLIDGRLDKYGYRRVLPDGSLVEDRFKKRGLSANPEKRVSSEELHHIVGYVIQGLREGKKE